MHRPSALRRPFGHRPVRRSGRRLATTVAVPALAVTCALTLSLPAGAASTKKSGHGQQVDVLYAGSLVTVMEQALGPAFEGATGYTFSGFSGGSTALASDIKGGIQQGDVFVSASPAVNASLQGKSDGDWVSWYATFATSPLVIGYDPDSRFAHDLQTKPWYQVITEPGFLLGRTDPTTDPKGQLALEALAKAASVDHATGLDQITADNSDVFPEETLVGRLQSGQLDAGFFYTAEATAAGIPTISLGKNIDLDAQYTVTVLNRAPHAKAAKAFVKFMFGKVGQSILRHDGFTLVTPPTVSGSHAPEDLKATLHAR